MVKANVGDVNLILDFAKRNDVVIHTIGELVLNMEELQILILFLKQILSFCKALSFNTDGLFFRVEEANDFDKILTDLIDEGFL